VATAKTNNRHSKRRPKLGPPDARVIKAIGHPLRWKMLEALNEEDASPVQLARRFGEGVNLVAYHMRILAEVGAAELVRTEPRRGSTEHYYRATMRPYFADREWARLPLETRRAVLDAEVGKILKDVRAAAGQNGLDHPQAHVSWTPLSLDRTGMAEVADLLESVLRELNEIQARVHGRQATKRGRKAVSLSTEVAMLHFERRDRRRKRS
jgi:DNA-binding transcriptional ArsR family regulator